MRGRPVLIRREEPLVALLRGRREALGLSHAVLDETIGWASGYASKVEAPHRRYGKRLFIFLTGLADELLQGLGLGLVLMDRRDAEALCRDGEAPDMTAAQAAVYPKRQRKSGLMVERRVRIGLVFKRAV
jgi:hypothetical protein